MIGRISRRLKHQVDARARQRALRRFFAPLVRPDQLVFDVGANIGELTAIFTDLGMHVIAVEPQAQCVEILARKFGQNHHVVIEPIALGAADGSAELAISSDSHAISTLSEHWKQGRFAHYRWDQSELVTVKTLDGLIGQYGRPDYCKIDVEGFEDEVLAGLSESISLVSFEWVEEDLPRCAACIARLETLGHYEFGYTGMPTVEFARSWNTASSVLEALRQAPAGATGDVYARRL